MTAAGALALANRRPLAYRGRQSRGAGPGRLPGTPRKAARGSLRPAGSRIA